jgi:alanyl-tRNA synthetase
MARMQDDAKAQQRVVRAFQEKLAAHEAQALLVKGPIVVEVLEGWDAQGLKAIAVAAAAARPDAVIVLFTATTPAQVVIARGPESSVDANALLKQLATEFGGKGGGKPDLAQGGGLNAGAEALIAAARAVIE